MLRDQKQLDAINRVLLIPNKEYVKYVLFNTLKYKNRMIAKQLFILKNKLFFIFVWYKYQLKSNTGTVTSNKYACETSLEKTSVVDNGPNINIKWWQQIAKYPFLKFL